MGSASSDVEPAEWCQRALAASEGFEFSSWQLACRASRKLDDEERLELARGLRAAVAELLQQAWPGVARGHDEADICLLLDMEKNCVELDSRPLCLYSRYRKRSREMSQTAFFCRRCRGRGRGCSECGGSGLLVAESVERNVLAPLLAQAGTERARFHGMGREDVDVQMLGRGRPFIVELQGPRKRSLDLVAARAALPATIDIDPWRVIGRKAIAQLKAATPDKTYLLQVETEAQPASEALDQLQPQLQELVLQQRNPSRVPRRADIVRTRTVRSGRVRTHNPLTIEVRAQSGTYIKELVSGDAGRTTPSLASLLGVPCRCVALDVLEIHADDPEEVRVSSAAEPPAPQP